MIKKLSIRQPDDWHVHFREDEMARVITKHSSRINRRCIAMPNTTVPITTSAQAKNYKSIIEKNSNHKNFEALIPCYITDNKKKFSKFKNSFGTCFNSVWSLIH